MRGGGGEERGRDRLGEEEEGRREGGIGCERRRRGGDREGYVGRGGEGRAGRGILVDCLLLYALTYTLLLQIGRYINIFGMGCVQCMYVTFKFV